MIDWKKEQATVNYCTYCIDTTSPCDGYCFKELKNRQDHLLRELKVAQERVKDILEELRKDV